MYEWKILDVLAEEHTTCMPDERLACFRCATCCIAPDISTLGKPIGTPCPHLQPDNLCGIYAHRPPVCREYRPDEICLRLQALPEAERVDFFLGVYDLKPAGDSGV